jgi:FMN reductase
MSFQSEVSLDPGGGLEAVAISGSPSERSKSRRLLDVAVRSLEQHGVAVSTVDLSSLPADALLGRVKSDAVEEAIAAVNRAHIVLASTPVYRATYSGLLKVFFDLLSPDSLARTVAVPLATGGSPGHQLVLDHGLGPLFASLGATVVPTGIYGTDAQFAGGDPDSALARRIERSIDEALATASALNPSLSSPVLEP